MNRLLKQTVGLAAAAMMLAATPGALAQTGEDEGALSVVPLPEECVTEPLEQSAVEAMLSGGEAVAVLPDGLPLPLGEPANRDTDVMVTNLTRELIACLNADDNLRAASLLSESGIRGFFAGAVDSGEEFDVTPTARSEDQYIRLRAVTDVSVMADGRVAAFALIADPLVPLAGPQTLLLVFSPTDTGELLLDGVLGFSVLAPAGTPTP